MKRAASEAQPRAERAAVERAAAEAREEAASEAQKRAAAAARENQQKPENDLDSFFGMGTRATSAPKGRSSSTETTFDAQAPNKSGFDFTQSAFGSDITAKEASSTTNFVDDLVSIFGVVHAGRLVKKATCMPCYQPCNMKLGTNSTPSPCDQEFQLYWMQL